MLDCAENDLRSAELFNTYTDTDSFLLPFIALFSCGSWKHRGQGVIRGRGVAPAQLHLLSQISRRREAQVEGARGRAGSRRRRGRGAPGARREARVRPRELARASGQHHHAVRVGQTWRTRRTSAS